MRQGSVSYFLVPILALLGVGLLSCKNTASTGPITTTALDSIVFNTGFPLTGPLTGVFRSPSDSTEQVYFADAVTSKTLLLFSPEGDLLHSVLLNQALDSLHQIASLSIVDQDTIVLSSVYTNRIAYIDRTGRCYRVLDLNEELRQTNGLQYEFWPSLTSPFMLDGSGCFEVALVAASIDTYKGDQSTKDDNSTYYTLASTGPKLARVDLTKIPVRVIWGPETPTVNSVSTVLATPEIGTYTCLNGKWIVFSTYSPVVSIVDPITIQELKQFTINSDHTATHLPGIKVPKDQKFNIQDSVNHRRALGGCIRSIHYDQPSHHYLVSLLHRTSRPVSSDGQVGSKNYSILEYDADFNFVQEKVFQNATHVLPFMLTLARGTYVLRLEDKRTQMRGIHVFDRLSLDAD